jgi:hypothetical protein
MLRSLGKQHLSAFFLTHLTVVVTLVARRLSEGPAGRRSALGRPRRLPRREGKFYRQIPFHWYFPYGRMAPLKKLFR